MIFKKFSIRIKTDIYSFESQLMNSNQNAKQKIVPRSAPAQLMSPSRYGPIVSDTRTGDWSLISSRSIKVAHDYADGSARADDRMPSVGEATVDTSIAFVPRARALGQITACSTKTPRRQRRARSTICAARQQNVVYLVGKGVVK